MPDCKYCKLDAFELVLELSSAVLLLPDRPHVSAEEGGHLIVIPRSHIADRRSLSPSEALSVDLLTMIAADALRMIFDADWQNYQENGNWTPDPEHGHAHVHIYGRRKDAVEQPFGEALCFPRSRSRNEWQVGVPNASQVAELRACARRLRSRYHHFDSAIRPTGKGRLAQN